MQDLPIIQKTYDLIKWYMFLAYLTLNPSPYKGEGSWRQDEVLDFI
jgi:hypothetical protein